MEKLMIKCPKCGSLITEWILKSRVIWWVCKKCGYGWITDNPERW